MNEIKYKDQPHAPHIFRWAIQGASQGNPLYFRNGVVLPVAKPALFTITECENIIALLNSDDVKTSLTGTGSGVYTRNGRTSMEKQIFSVPDYEWIFNRIEQYVQNINQHFQFRLTGFFEGAQIYEYPVGGYLNEHMDIGLNHMSTRKLGITVQLSPGDSYDGGDLRFADSDKPAPRDQGCVIAFPAYMRHRVSEVTRGKRCCIVTWVHGPPFQ